MCKPWMKFNDRPVPKNVNRVTFFADKQFLLSQLLYLFILPVSQFYHFLRLLHYMYMVYNHALR